jgi:2-amino-4-hydroxy-6-hydroxymethyldihydropteridine pyrophosphokinase
MATIRAFIGLGSNLGDSEFLLLGTFDELDTLPSTRLVARSSLYRSAPLGYTDQPDFINAVAEIETGLSPRQLLEALLDMEHRHGRVRDFLNGPRTLDLDILLYDGLMVHEPGLTLPHPRIGDRAFVLRPLLEIAPDCVVPGVGPAAGLLYNCEDQRLEKLPATALEPDVV